MYLDATDENGANVFRHGFAGPVTMLNLLRFREVADYTATPEIAPSEPISGRGAYDRYIAHALPHLATAGSELTFIGEGGPLLIGPTEAHWDLVLLVRHASLERFVEFARNEAYQSGIGHRTAALADSRLLPLTERGQVSPTAG